MPDPESSPVTLATTIESFAPGAIVMLKLTLGSAADAARRLQLAEPLRVSGVDPRSVWFGPDCWFLMSRETSAETMIERCNLELPGILHNAVDYSAALAAIRIAGPAAETLLASGSGVDFRRQSFAAGSCCRTRLAQVAATVVATGDREFEIFVDRSYERYLLDWLRDSAEIAARAQP